MTHLRLQGPHDGSVTPLIGHQHSYRAATGTYTVVLPPLARVGDGLQVAVQRYSLDTGTTPIVVTCAPGDTLSDDRTGFALVNAGDLYLLEASSLAGVRSWLVIDVQTIGRASLAVTDNGDGGGTLN